MKINKVSEYILKDAFCNEVRIKFGGYIWHLIIGDETVFTFNEDEAKHLAKVFGEISSNRTISELEEIKLAVPNRSDLISVPT